MSFESTSTANVTRSWLQPRARGLTAFAACLMLILPMHALADEIVYFTNGKAMTVKKIEKGDRFTILELEGGGRIGVPNDRIASIETLELPRPPSGASAPARIATPLQTGQQNDRNRRTAATTPTPSVSPTGAVGREALAGGRAGAIQQSSDAARNLARRRSLRTTGQNTRGVGPGGRITSPAAGRFGYGQAGGNLGRTGGRGIRGGSRNQRANQRLNNRRQLPAAAAVQSTGQRTPANENEASPSDEAASEEN
ncbi:MAG: hypothetical protein V3U83_04460 [Acidobacteriota bacterium]